MTRFDLLTAGTLSPGQRHQFRLLSTINFLYGIQRILIALDVRDQQFGKQTNRKQLNAHEHQQYAQDEQWTRTEFCALKPLYRQPDVDQKPNTQHERASPSKEMQGSASVAAQEYDRD